MCGPLETTSELIAKNLQIDISVQHIDASSACRFLTRSYSPVQDDHALESVCLDDVFPQGVELGTLKPAAGERLQAYELQNRVQGVSRGD